MQIPNDRFVSRGMAEEHLKSICFLLQGQPTHFNGNAKAESIWSPDSFHHLRCEQNARRSIAPGAGIYSNKWVGGASVRSDSLTVAKREPSAAAAWVGFLGTPFLFCSIPYGPKTGSA